MMLLIIFGVVVAYLIIGVLLVALFNFFDTRDPNALMLDDSTLAGVMVFLWPFGLLLCVAAIICTLTQKFTKFLGRLTGIKYSDKRASPRVY